jgi:hypothetical protein
MVDYGVGDGAVVLVAQVVRRNKVMPLFEDGSDEKVYPFRSDASKIGVHHRAGLHIQLLRNLKDGSEGASLAWNAVVGRHDLLYGIHALGDEERFVIMKNH